VIVFQFGGASSFILGAKPTKAPRGEGTDRVPTAKKLWQRHSHYTPGHKWSKRSSPLVCPRDHGPRRYVSSECRWRVGDSTAREPLAPSTRLERVQVPFFKFSVWRLGRERTG